MTLTQFIKDDEIESMIDNEFPNKGKRVSDFLQVDWKNKQYTRIGMGVDYLIRFWLADNATVVDSEVWKAYYGIHNLRVQDQITDEETDNFVRAVRFYMDDLDEDEIENPMKYILDLARLEEVYRSGRYDTNDSYEDESIQDLQEILALVPESELSDVGRVICNPSFGRASELVGMADADLIVDDTLVDIKTTSNNTFKIDYWRQLVGYAILIDICIETGGRNYNGELTEWAESANMMFNFMFESDVWDTEFESLTRPEYVGVYFSRHGVLQKIPTTHIYGHDEYEEIRASFIERALELHDDVQRKPFSHLLGDTYDDGQVSLGDF